MPRRLRLARMLSSICKAHAAGARPGWEADHQASTGGLPAAAKWDSRPQQARQEFNPQGKGDAIFLISCRSWHSRPQLVTQSS